MSHLSSLPERYKKKEDFQITKELLKSCTYEELRVEPFAWLSCFKEELKEEVVKKRITDYVSQEEATYKSSVLGANALRQQNLRKPFKPKEKSRTPYIICHDKELRISEIDSYRLFCSLCSEAWELIKKGIKAIWPKGAYLPAFYRGWALSG